MDSANGRPARPGRDVETKGPGRRRFRPSVTGLEGRQLMAASALSTVASVANTRDQLVGGLAIDGQGDLFGTTSVSGAGGGLADSTVFEIADGAKAASTVATFNGSGGYGIGTLAVDGRGDLFDSAAELGGAYGDGRVIEIPRASKSISVVARFDGADGEYPDGVTMDARGDLYGTTATGYAVGGATVYEIPSGSKSIVTLATFPTAGSAPKGVVVDGQGDVFGVNAAGGPKNADGAGSIYEVARGSGAVTTLATFPSLDGAGLSNVILDGQGNLYGTSSDGGAEGDGEVFEVARGSGTVTPLASFDELNGAVPDPGVGLVMDARGNLYGATADGGAYGDGTIFEVARGSDRATVLASFEAFKGSSVGALLLDGRGDLYGTADGQGSSNGTVFKLALPGQAAVLDPPSAIGPARAAVAAPGAGQKG